MSQNTVTTEQVHELIEQMAAMTAAASITPEIVANIFENMRQLNDQEREKVIATAEAYIAEIQNTGISAEKVHLVEVPGLNADNAQDAVAEIFGKFGEKITDIEDTLNGTTIEEVSLISSQGDDTIGWYILKSALKAYQNSNSAYIGNRLAFFPCVSGGRYILNIPKSGNSLMSNACYHTANSITNGGSLSSLVDESVGTGGEIEIEFEAENYPYIVVGYKYEDSGVIYGNPTLKRIVDSGNVFDKIDEEISEAKATAEEALDLANEISDEILSKETWVEQTLSQGVVSSTGVINPASANYKYAKIEVTEGDVFDVCLCKAGADTATAVGYYDANNAFYMQYGQATKVEEVITIPSSIGTLSNIKYVVFCTLANSASLVYYVKKKVVTKGVNERLDDIEEQMQNVSGNRNIVSFLPSRIYALNGMPLRIYPYNLINVNSDEYSLDVFLARPLSNEHVSVLAQSTTSNSWVKDGDVLTYKIRNYDGEVKTLGTTTVKKVTPTNPSSKEYIICLGDSLTEYIYNNGKTGADIDRGTGAWVNEFSRILSGVGDAIPNGITSYNLSNYEVIGTRGSGVVKHEGRGGWSINDYLTKAGTGSQGEEEHPSTDYVPNAFWDATNEKFSVDYYLSANGFSGVTANGSNLSLIILLNWNNVYSMSDSAFITEYKQMIDNILAEKPNAKIYIVGMNCPPNKIVKSWSGNRNVSTASIKEDCFRIEKDLENIASAYVNVYHIPLMPFFYAEGSYSTTTAYKICPRANDAPPLYTDYVHPNEQGFGQIADIVACGFLCNR